MPRRRLAVLTLVLAGALTAGCATAAPVAETATATPTPTLDASPTPTPSATADAGPVRAFDADCAQMLTNDQRDAILGMGSRTAVERAQQTEPDRPLPVRMMSPERSAGSPVPGTPAKALIFRTG